MTMVHPRSPTMKVRGNKKQQRGARETETPPSKDNYGEGGGSGRTSSILLVDLIEAQQFQQAIQRVREYPSEACMSLPSTSSSSEGGGNLALHEACKNQPPVELIDALLKAYESAVQTKGQWGYLPLHLACCSRASPEVIAKLILAYPSATRTKDDHEGFLPLHLASKSGADEEVIMALLTVHPKASAVRDLKGKTPIDHASALSFPHVRETVIKALHRAPLLCAVSKAAMNKLSYENDAKLREVVNVYQDRMMGVKERYDSDKTKAEALEVQLRKELWEEKERSALLSEKVAMLETKLQEKQEEMEEREQLFEEIQDLISGKRKTNPQVASMKKREELKSQEKEKKEMDRAQQQMTKYALREWVSAGHISSSREQPSPSGGSNNNHQSDMDDEQREPPPQSSPSKRTSAVVTPAKSPRSAAVATVKEWFSSDTQEEVRQPSEENNHQRTSASGGGRISRPTTSQRDKVDQYRSHVKRSQTSNIPAQGTSKYASNEQNQQKPQISNEEKKQSLLSRSKTAGRSSAVLARRDYHRKSTAKTDNNKKNQEYIQTNQHTKYNHHSGSNVPSRDRPRASSSRPSTSHKEPQHQQSKDSSEVRGDNDSDMDHVLNEVLESSGSSRYTQKTQHGKKSGDISPSARYVNNNYHHHGQSSRSRSTSTTSIRPRETYSTTRAQTSAYSHRITDDANETYETMATMDSTIVWE